MYKKLFYTKQTQTATLSRKDKHEKLIELWRKAYAAIHRDQWAIAQMYMDLAIEINPRFTIDDPFDVPQPADTAARLVYQSWLQAYIGNHQQAQRLAQQALALNPFVSRNDPFAR